MVWFLSEKYLPAAPCYTTQAQSTKKLSATHCPKRVNCCCLWIVYFIPLTTAQVRDVFKVYTNKGASEAPLSFIIQGNHFPSASVGLQLQLFCPHSARAAAPLGRLSVSTCLLFSNKELPTCAAHYRTSILLMKWINIKIIWYITVNLMVKNFFMA